MRIRATIVAFCALLCFSAAASAQTVHVKSPPLFCFFTGAATDPSFAITNTFQLSGNQIVYQRNGTVTTSSTSIHVEQSSDYLQQCPTGFASSYGQSAPLTGICVTLENGSPVSGDLTTFFILSGNPLGYSARCGGLALTIPQMSGSFDIRVSPNQFADAVPSRILFDFGYSCDSLVPGGFGGGLVCRYTHITVPVELSPGVPPPPPPPAQTMPNVGAMLSGGAPETADPATGAVTAHVPLGAEFQIWLQDKAGTRVESTYLLGAHHFDAALDANSLFPDSVIFEYSASSTAQRADFQAAHKGNALLTITPVDGGLQPVVVTVQVDDPASLGTSHQAVDALILPVANRKGILPQFVKGQVEQESTGSFDPYAYRYEPLGPDVGDFTTISRGLDYRTQAPYSNYRIESQQDCQDAPLAQGAGFQANGTQSCPSCNDFGRRSIYSVCRNGSCRPITANDQNVLGWEIISANPRANWQTANPGNYRRMSVAVQRGNACGYIWTAQTGLASSYGYMQVTYVHAIDTLHWTGTNTGAQNPSYLFDSPENLATQGGSLGLGVESLRRYLHQHFTSDILNPNFDTEGDLEDLMLAAWGNYNQIVSYPTDVQAKTRAYHPVPGGSIFR